MIPELEALCQQIPVPLIDHFGRGVFLVDLRVLFNLSIPGSPTDNHLLLDALDRKLQQVADQAEDLAAEWGGDHFPHDRIRQDLTLALLAIAKQLGGQSLGRDFVMWLGDNGFTLNLMFFQKSGVQPPVLLLSR